MNIKDVMDFITVYLRMVFSTILLMPKHSERSMG